MKDKTTSPSPSLSLVVPFYNERENIPRLYQKIKLALAEVDFNYELIFVDDGSDDGSREILRDLAHKDCRVKSILFRSNFGQSAAMAAGFKQTRGDIVVAMDGDLQNDPADILVLMDKLNEGYDVVSGWRKNRKDAYLIRKVPSKIANRLICSVTDVRLHDTGCSLKAFRGDLLRRMALYGEMHRFIPALLRMEGAHIAEIPVRHHARRYGRSKYNLSRTFRVIMDLTTIRLLMKHLKNPLTFFAPVSLVFFVFGLSALWVMGHKVLLRGNSFQDVNILLILVVLCWVTGLQFFFYGLIGRLIVGSGTRRRF
ncbi:glycosyltransferase family 2 protein [candidate division KSB1 bacterium]|nr:glycosyltransferase family 2 protein [candidate division KSB1 bacterium]